MKRLWIDGVGVWGPGLDGWAESAPVLAGARPYVAAPLRLPAAEALPPAERRRVGLTLKLALAAGLDAARGVDTASLASVFCSTGADCDNCHQILETLASPSRAVSPTRFHNSVHNMPAGYWGIATGSMAPSTTLCAFDATFGAGLLEAATQAAASGRPCLLVAYDTPYPEPIHACRPLPAAAGVGLLLSAEPGARSIASLDLSLCTDAATGLDDPALEALRAAVPTARALPLLRLLARGEAGRVVVDAIAPQRLCLTVAPMPGGGAAPGGDAGGGDAA